MTPRRVRTLTVTGTEGIINVAYTTKQLSIENDEMTIQPYIAYSEPLKRELSSFVAHVLDDEEPEITDRDDLKAWRVCEAALKSSATKKRVSLTP